MKSSLVLIVCLVVTCQTVTEEQLEMFVSDASHGSSVDVDWTTFEDNTNDFVVITANGIPNHAVDASYGAINNQLYVIAQTKTYYIPKTPTKWLKTMGLKIQPRDGDSGVFINGVPLRGPFTRAFSSSAGSTAEYLDEQLDSCRGHPDGNNEYHYHTDPVCLTIVGGDKQCDQFLGYALDGYAIYGPYDAECKTIDVDSSIVLDDDHGHDRNGEWVYRITYAPPYVFRNYRGVPYAYKNSDGKPRGGTTGSSGGGQGSGRGGQGSGRGGQGSGRGGQGNGRGGQGTGRGGQGTGRGGQGTGRGGQGTGRSGKQKKNSFGGLLKALEDVLAGRE